MSLFRQMTDLHTDDRRQTGFHKTITFTFYLPPRFGTIVRQGIPEMPKRIYNIYKNPLSSPCPLKQAPTLQQPQSHSNAGGVASKHSMHINSVSAMIPRPPLVSREHVYTNYDNFASNVDVIVPLTRVPS